MRLIDVDAYIKYCKDKGIPLNIVAVNAQPIIDAVPVIRKNDWVNVKWTEGKDDNETDRC